MRVIALIEPPQADVIEKILRHCALWHSSSSRAPPDADAFARDPADDWYRQPIVGISLREMYPVSRSETTTVRRQPADDEPRERTFVDEDTFWSEF